MDLRPTGRCRGDQARRGRHQATASLLDGRSCSRERRNGRHTRSFLMTRVSRSGNQPPQQPRSAESAAPAQGGAREPGPLGGLAQSPRTQPRRLDASAISGPPPLSRRVVGVASSSDREAIGPALPLAHGLGSGLSLPRLRGAPALFEQGSREVAPRAGLPVPTLAPRNVGTTRNAAVLRAGQPAATPTRSADADADADAEVAFINSNAGKAPPSLR